jgi:4-hydroxybenzoate polyprenyltransferase
MIHMPLFGLGFLFITGVLWFYSTTYKRQLIIGNLVISFLTALVPLMVVLFEVSVLRVAYFKEVIIHGITYFKLFAWVGGYAAFAFITTLIREIIKDTEDFEGDNAFGLNTLPIAFGVPVAKMVIIALTGITLASLSVVYAKFMFWKHPIPDSPDYLSMVYIFATIFVPLVYLIYSIALANKKADYSRASYLVKFVMLSGIVYSLLFNFFVY